MSTTVASTLTFEEFERLPDPPDGRYELLRGELVLVPPPKKLHKLIQMTVERWLLQRLPREWECVSEFAVRLEDDSCLIADVAVVQRTRWESTRKDSYFEGAPELAVELISPGNTAAEIDEKISLYLENGALECWIVNPVRKSVTVHSVDQPWRGYSGSDGIPLTRFGITEPLPASALFGD